MILPLFLATHLLAAQFAVGEGATLIRHQAVRGGNARAVWLGRRATVAFVAKGVRAWTVRSLAPATGRVRVIAKGLPAVGRLSRGPVGTVVAEGPCRELILGKPVRPAGRGGSALTTGRSSARPKAKSRRPPPKSSGSRGVTSRRTGRSGSGVHPLAKKGRTAPALRRRLCAPGQRLGGLYLLGHGRSQYLLPGSRPAYSPAARRLLFRHRGVLYLWDPAKAGTQGLLLLTPGVRGVWSPDGNALAVQRSNRGSTAPSPPTRAGRKGKPFRGGILVLDKQFRAASVARDGRQVAWGGRGRGSFLVYRSSRCPDARPRGRSRPRPSAGPGPRRPRSRSGCLVHLPLRGRPKPKLLARGATWPAVAADARRVAFTIDGPAVVVRDLATGRQQTICKGCTRPTWSSSGLVLVDTPKGFAVLRPLRTAKATRR